MDDLLLFQRLVSPDSQLAATALRSLEPKITRFLWSYLASILPRQDDRQDAISEVLAKLWAHRERVQVHSAGSTWRYLAVMARRTALDMIGTRQSEELELNQEDVAYIDSVADRRLALRELYSSADKLWLGLDRNLSDRECSRRLLAAQLHYLEGRSWKEIVDLLRPGGDVTRDELDRWLIDVSILRLMACRHVYVTNEDLAALLLGCKPGDLVEVGKTGGYRERVVLYRYQNGLLKEKIAQLLPDLPGKAVDSVIKDCDRKLPFEAKAREVAGAIGRVSSTSPLEDQGVIKRLVFQYFVADNLPHKQIYERSLPVAKVWSQKLTEGMLNVWLSNGRLLSQLVSYAKEDSNHG